MIEKLRIIKIQVNICDKNKKPQNSRHQQFHCRHIITILLLPIFSIAYHEIWKYNLQIVYFHTYIKSKTNKIRSIRKWGYIMFFLCPCEACIKKIRIKLNRS